MKPEDSSKALFFLRESIVNRDWNEIRKNLIIILRLLPYRESLRVTLDQVGRQLPNFECNYANHSGPRDILEQLKVKVNSDLPITNFPLASPDLDKDYASPGDNSFIAAINYAVDSINHYDSDRSVDFLADAIENAIMSELDRVWGEKNLKDWNAWYHHNNSPDASKPNLYRLGMMDDPRVINVEQKIWMSLYDKLCLLLE